MCSLTETSNILTEQDKVMKSGLEQLKQNNHRTEYVEFVWHYILSVM